MVTERPATPPLVYRGAREICGAVGVPWKELARFVAEKGLPAWRIDGRGMWLALHDDLGEWIKQQRDEHLRRPQSELREADETNF